MRKEYKIIISSSSQNFFLSFYLFLRYFINKKLNRKKIKKGKLTKEYKEFIQKNLKIGEDWFTHNINNLDLIFKKKQLYNKELSVLELGSYEGNSSVFFLLSSCFARASVSEVLLNIYSMHENRNI